MKLPHYSVLPKKSQYFASKLMNSSWTVEVVLLTGAASWIRRGSFRLTQLLKGVNWSTEAGT
jgi:hypothetical protein